MPPDSPRKLALRTSLTALSLLYQCAPPPRLGKLLLVFRVSNSMHLLIWLANCIVVTDLYGSSVAIYPPIYIAIGFFHIHHVPLYFELYCTSDMINYV